jgi:hypothetical protein
MGFFGKMFGKKKEKQPSIQLKPTGTTSSLDQFASVACRSKSSISIQISQTAALIDALKVALQKEYQNLDSGEALSHAEGGLSLSCPKCLSVFSEQTIPMLYLVSKGVTQGAFFGGPNIAALGRGVCPTCGNSLVVATFDPSKIMARIQAIKASAPEVAKQPSLTAVCPSLGFQSSLEVSPDENMICFIPPPQAAGQRTVVAYDVGTTNQRWSLPVSATSCIKFVGQERILVLSKKNENESVIQLIDTEDGTIITESLGPKAYNSSADPKTGRFVAESALFTLLMIETAGDNIGLSTYKCGQIYSPGPMIGPDGNCYAIIYYQLCRITPKEKTGIMGGDHCICFDPEGKVYCGGGYFDRSGESALHVADLKTGSSTEIPYGRDPINKIALAGPGRLLLANIVDDRSVSKYPNAFVTLFSVPERKKIWDIKISDLKPWRNPLLLSVPDEDWALLQTGTLIKQISLQDGSTLRVLPKTIDENIEARWLALKKILYISRNTIMPYRPPSPGTLECYKI